MSPTRIHLGHMPPLLSAIIEDLLAREPDLVVIGHTGEGEDPLLRAREERADMLITSDPTDLDSPCLSALLSGPPLSVMAIAGDGRGARAIRLEPRPIGLERDDAGSFADAVRQVAERRR